MGNFKNRLTATQTPNWVAPSQESRPKSKTAPSRRERAAPSLPTRVVLAYPALGRRYPPPATSLFDFGYGFFARAGRTFLAYPVVPAYPALGNCKPARAFLVNVDRTYPVKVGRAYPGNSCLPCTRQVPPTHLPFFFNLAILAKAGRSYPVVLAYPTLNSQITNGRLAKAGPSVIYLVFRLIF